MTERSACLDRLEIQDLLASYCHAVDGHNWDKLRSIFTASAKLDLQALDGPNAGPEEAIQHLQEKLSRICHTQHSISTTTISLEGDTAKATSVGRIVVIWNDRFSNKQAAFLGLWYIDQLVRENEEWKISERSIECSWAQNIPHDRWVRNFVFTPRKQANLSLLQSMGL